jgi:hypothetical protein
MTNVSHVTQAIKCNELPVEIGYARDWPQHALREYRTFGHG